MIAVDSSVIIAALLSWHEAHDSALRALEKALARKQLLVPLAALIESYSVMTRLPSPHRLQAAVAHQLLHGSFKEARIVALSPHEAWPFLDSCVAASISGGRIYDAVIARSAIDAHARGLLTLHPRDFEAFSDRLATIAP